VSGEQNFRVGFPHVQFAEDAMHQPALGVSEIKICFAAHPDTQEAILEELTIATWIPELMTDEQTMAFTVLDEGLSVISQNLPPLPPLPEGQSPQMRFIDLDKFRPVNLVAEPEAAESTPMGRPRFLLPLSYVPSISVPWDFLEKTLVERLEYLGPIRSDPRPFYPAEETPDIGPRGEATVPYLLRHQSDQVRYALSLTGDLREATLLEATNDWLQRMNVTPHLTIEPVESIVYTAALESISASTHPVNLAQVGFGVSQLLPVLVMGLKNPTDGMLLLEQPEIHLHPRLQGELAEFLLCVARAGKTVIVETHSDHLINRLRRCIAEDETGTLSQLVNVLFVHSGTPDNPGSYVEPLEIDESGEIINWPDDFLTEAAQEAFAILRARQRKGRTIPT
jgi:hypothetical protein